MTAPQPLPDLLSQNLSVVFCGINPGMRAARNGHHFDGNGNRFWRTLHLAGFTPAQLRPEEDRRLLEYGCGSTAVVARPTASAGELSSHEFRAAAADLARKIEHFRPAYIAFLGKTAYAAMNGRRQLDWGEQPATFGGAKVWLLPNPSGLNRAFNQDALVEAYRALAVAALPEGRVT
ncbi:MULTISPECIES: G/U mismatch-specific DNA glycosylase [unclassified Achromobacter]|uniref:G/U mismatch-specific DNA glycosylase n=1 Tax=unclassified Achromobacter TaxID=2626865 RepID=UPI000B518812|nr:MULTISPECIES: G/U mismatch-specific DNA glycosylase [unclassified Achromobacter]OWT73637.1 double-stranded uracil-DNA glycosylase [Achromobacter sp. HZ34]OWT79447.1 double-stranded uracil-DNA glycosylase [Achromobacter sp. HZ28]